MWGLGKGYRAPVKKHRVPEEKERVLKQYHPGATFARLLCNSRDVANVYHRCHDLAAESLEVDANEMDGAQKGDKFFLSQSSFGSMSEMRLETLKKLFKSLETAKKIEASAPPGARQPPTHEKIVSESSFLSTSKTNHELLFVERLHRSNQPRIWIQALIGFFCVHRSEYKGGLLQRFIETEEAARLWNKMKKTYLDEYLPEEIRNEALSALMGYALLFGNLHYYSEILIILMEHVSEDHDFAVSNPKLLPLLERLNKYRSNLDSRYLASASLEREWREPLTSSNQNDKDSNTAMASDGPYIYTSSSQGLQKIGSGEYGTIFGHIYETWEHFRRDQNTQLFYCKGQLYCCSDRMEWLSIEAVDTNEIYQRNSIGLGIHALKSKPVEPAAPNLTLPIFSDGEFIYVVSYEQVSEESKESEELKEESGKKEKKLSDLFTPDKQISKKGVKGPPISPEDVIYKTPELKKHKSTRSLAQRYCVYVYDPERCCTNGSDLSLERDLAIELQDSKDYQELNKAAQMLHQTLGFQFSLELCKAALVESDFNVNEAARWLLENLENKYFQKKFALVKKIVLDRKGVGRDQHEMHFQNKMNFRFFASNRHFIIVHRGFPDNEHATLSCYDKETGDAIDTAIVKGVIGDRSCYDSVTGRILNASLQYPKIIQIFKNPVIDREKSEIMEEILSTYQVAVSEQDEEKVSDVVLVNKQSMLRFLSCQLYRLQRHCFSAPSFQRISNSSERLKLFERSNIFSDQVPFLPYSIELHSSSLDSLVTAHEYVVDKLKDNPKDQVYYETSKHLLQTLYSNMKYFLDVESSVKKSKAEPALNCPGKHGLSYHHVIRSSFSCDICKYPIRVRSILHSCRICDYDVCMPCLADAIQKKKKELREKKEDEHKKQFPNQKLQKQMSEVVPVPLANKNFPMFDTFIKSLKVLKTLETPELVHLSKEITIFGLQIFYPTVESQFLYLSTSIKEIFAEIRDRLHHDLDKTPENTDMDVSRLLRLILNSMLNVYGALDSTVGASLPLRAISNFSDVLDIVLRHSSASRIIRMNSLFHTFTNFTAPCIDLLNSYSEGKDMNKIYELCSDLKFDKFKRDGKLSAPVEFLCLLLKSMLLHGNILSTDYHTDEGMISVYLPSILSFTYHVVRECRYFIDKLTAETQNYANALNKLQAAIKKVEKEASVDKNKDAIHYQKLKPMLQQVAQVANRVQASIIIQMENLRKDSGLVLLPTVMAVLEHTLPVWLQNVDCLGPPTKSMLSMLPDLLLDLLAQSEKFSVVYSSFCDSRIYLGDKARTKINRDAAYVQNLEFENNSRSIHETEHQYGVGDPLMKSILRIPNADAIVISFDSRSATVNNQDFLQLYTDASFSRPYNGEQYSGNKRDKSCTFPETLIIPGSVVGFMFRARNQVNAQNDTDATRWGFRAVCRGIQMSSLLSWHLEFPRTIAFTCKKIAQSKLNARKSESRNSVTKYLADPLFVLEERKNDTSTVEDYIYFNEKAKKNPVLAKFEKLFQAVQPTKSFLTGGMLLRRKSKEIQELWTAGIRGIVVSSLFFTGTDFRSVVDSSQSKESRKLGVSLIALAKDIQIWMLRQVQNLKSWTYWYSEDNEFSFKKFSVDYSHRNSFEKLVDTVTILNVCVSPGHHLLKIKDSDTQPEILANLFKYYQQTFKDMHYFAFETDKSELKKDPFHMVASYVARFSLGMLQSYTNSVFETTLEDKSIDLIGEIELFEEEDTDTDIEDLESELVVDTPTVVSPLSSSGVDTPPSTPSLESRRSSLVIGESGDSINKEEEFIKSFLSNYRIWKDWTKTFEETNMNRSFQRLPSVEDQDKEGEETELSKQKKSFYLKKQMVLSFHHMIENGTTMEEMKDLTRVSREKAASRKNGLEYLVKGLSTVTHYSAAVEFLGLTSQFLQNKSMNSDIVAVSKHTKKTLQESYNAYLDKLIELHYKVQDTQNVKLRLLSLIIVNELYSQDFTSDEIEYVLKDEKYLKLIKGLRKSITENEVTVAKDNSFKANRLRYFQIFKLLKECNLVESYSRVALDFSMAFSYLQAKKQEKMQKQKKNKKKVAKKELHFNEYRDIDRNPPAIIGLQREDANQGNWKAEPAEFILENGGQLDMPELAEPVLLAEEPEPVLEAAEEPVPVENVDVEAKPAEKEDKKAEKEKADPKDKKEKEPEEEKEDPAIADQSDLFKQLIKKDVNEIGNAISTLVQATKISYLRMTKFQSGLPAPVSIYFQKLYLKNFPSFGEFLDPSSATGVINPSVYFSDLLESRGRKGGQEYLDSDLFSSTELEIMVHFGLLTDTDTEQDQKEVLKKFDELNEFDPDQEHPFSTAISSSQQFFDSVFKEAVFDNFQTFSNGLFVFQQEFAQKLQHYKAASQDSDFKKEESLLEALHSKSIKIVKSYVESMASHVFDVLKSGNFSSNWDLHTLFELFLAQNIPELYLSSSDPLSYEFCSLLLMIISCPAAFFPATFDGALGIFQQVIHGLDQKELLKVFNRYRADVRKEHQLTIFKKLFADCENISSHLIDFVMQQLIFSGEKSQGKLSDWESIREIEKIDRYQEEVKVLFEHSGPKYRKQLVHENKTEEKKEEVEKKVEPSSSPSSFSLVVHRDTESDPTVSYWSRVLQQKQFHPLVGFSAQEIERKNSLLSEEEKKKIHESYEARKKHRVGPNDIELELIKGGWRKNDMHITSQATYATVVATCGATKGGKWYYEVVLPNAGVKMIGWALDTFAPQQANIGVGDDEHGWSYDGCRLRAYHKGNKDYSVDINWHAGDTIGCALDLDTREIEYFLNGESLGVAFEGDEIPLEHIKNSRIFYPAASLSNGEQIKFVFSREACRFLPPSYSTLEKPRSFEQEALITSCNTFARSMIQDLNSFGICSVYTGTYAECCKLGPLLGQEGCVISVIFTQLLPQLKLKDPNDPNASGNGKMQVNQGNQGYLDLFDGQGFNPNNENEESPVPDTSERFFRHVIDGKTALRMAEQIVQCLRLMLFKDKQNGLLPVLDKFLSVDPSIMTDKDIRRLYCVLMLFGQQDDQTRTTFVNMISDLAFEDFLIKLIKVSKEFVVSPHARLRIHAVNVICSFISTLPTCSQPSKSISELFSQTVKHIVKLSYTKKHALSSVSTATDRLNAVTQRLWNVDNEINCWFVEQPFTKLKLLDGYVPHEPASKYVYGESPFARFGIDEEKSSPGSSENKMLKYWEKNIIPKIQDYVRGSFQEYEMVYFFETLRQPLRAGNQQRAIEIAYTLCANRLPDGIVFPPNDKDWSTLLFEDVYIGQRLELTDAIVAESISNDIIETFIGTTGTVVCVDPDSELMLLSFYRPRFATVELFWINVDCVVVPSSTSLREAGFGKETEFASFLRTKDQLTKVFQSTSDLYCSSRLRSCILNLCSTRFEDVQNAVFTKDSKDLATLFDFVLESITTSVQFTDLATIGSPSDLEARRHLTSLENRFYQYLAKSVKDNQKLSKKIREIFFVKYEELAKDMKKFMNNTILRDSHECDIKHQHDIREISIPGAVGFVILFSSFSSVPAGCSAAFYSDKECTSVLKLLDGGKGGLDNITPIVTTGDRIYMRISEPKKNRGDVRFKLRIIPISQNTPKLFWLTNFMVTRCCTSQEIFGDQKSEVEICYLVVSKLLQMFPLKTEEPSPYKGSVLRLMTSILEKISSIKTDKEMQSNIESETLKKVSHISSEMKELFGQESRSKQFTSYLQQVVYLNVVADNLRSKEEKSIRSFVFSDGSVDEDAKRKEKEEEERKKKAAEEKKKASAQWACAICTFLNSNKLPTCDMCGSPKPAAQPKSSQNEDQKSNANDEMTNKVFHDFSCLLSIIKYFYNIQKQQKEGSMQNLVLQRKSSELTQKELFDMCPAMEPLVESSWKLIRNSYIEPAQNISSLRLFYIQNLPYSTSYSVRDYFDVVERYLHASHPEIRLNYNAFYVGVDPSKPKPSAPKSQLKMNSKYKLFKGIVGNQKPPQGIITYLARDLDFNGAVYTNPVSNGYMSVFASSENRDSRPCKSILDQKVVKFWTANKANSYVEFVFEKHNITPMFYSVQHFAQYNNHCLRNWRFEGFNVKTKSWDILRNHINDQSLNVALAWYTWQIDLKDKTVQYSKVRIYQYGQNSAVAHNLAIGGFEIYGKLWRKELSKGKYHGPLEKTKPMDTNVFAVFEITSNKSDVQADVLKSLDGCTMDCNDPTSAIAIRTKAKCFRATDLIQKAGSQKFAFEYAASRFASSTYLMNDESHKEEKFPESVIEDEKNESNIKNLFYYSSKEKKIDKTSPYCLCESFLKHFSMKFGEFESIEKFLETKILFSKFLEILKKYCNPESERLLKSQFFDKLDNKQEYTFSEIISKGVMPMIFSCTGETTLFLGVCLRMGMDENFNLATFSNSKDAFLSQRIWETKGTTTTQTDLFRYFSSIASKYGVQVSDLDPTQIPVPTKADYDLFPTLYNINAHHFVERGNPFFLASLRLRFCIMDRFNRLISDLLPLIQLKVSSQRNIHDGLSSVEDVVNEKEVTGDTIDMCGLVRKVRSFIFKSVKSAFFESVLKVSAVEEINVPEVRIKRLNLKINQEQQDEKVEEVEEEDREDSKKNDFVDSTNFGISMRQLIDVDPLKLRPAKPHGTEPFIAFNVLYEGELVVGEAGPYRQIFSDIGEELQDVSHVPLLVQATNGAGADLYLINPSEEMNSQQSLRYYEFLGMLFGFCVRTGVRLPVELSSFFWKGLTGDTLYTSDLAQIDGKTAKFLNSLLYISENVFNKTCKRDKLCYVTYLSDGRRIELIPNGANTPVEYKHLQAYVDLSLSVRSYYEQYQQIQAIRVGISKIIPLQLLEVLTWTELKLIITGSAEIDVDLLKEHTIYNPPALETDGNLIKWFWSVIREYSQEMKKRFIRFVWAQARLPSDHAEFLRSHTRLMIKADPKNYQNEKEVNMALPHSDTCFMNLTLPHYTSRENLEKKLTYAILHTKTMNADELPREAEENVFGGGMRF